jgi:signal transduction histidine kinase
MPWLVAVLALSQGVLAGSGAAAGSHLPSGDGPAIRYARQPPAFAWDLSPGLAHNWTFYALCVGGLLLGVAAFEAFRHSAQRRIHHLEKQAALAAERERIARDLHDDLGASLDRIARLSQAARKELDADSPAAARLADVCAITNEVVDSLGELVWATNPKYDDLQSLAAYFREYAARFFEPTRVVCRLCFPTDPPPRPLAAEFRRELFLILKEALLNVARHAQATHVEVSLVLEGDCLELVVQDDGQGFAASEPPGFHHGLKNLHARAAHLRGVFDLRSAPGQGARLAVRVPLPAS